MSELKQKRQLNVDFPILLPSFSSKGIPHVKAIFDFMREYFSSSYLISAFDVDKGFIPSTDLFVPGLLFVDSGGYEANKQFDVFESYNEDVADKQWSIDKYQNVLNEIVSKNDPAKIVATIFDVDIDSSFDEQLQKARNFKTNNSQIHVNFLIKPESGGAQISLDRLKSIVPNLCEFDVIGVTEKEIGSNLVERMKNIQLLRSEMDKAGVNNPIHIFGCLEPAAIIAFTISGAQIFDGLSWLRYYMRSTGLFYKAQYVLHEPGDIEIPDAAVDAKIVLNNYLFLARFEKLLREYSREKDISVFKEFTGVQHIETWLSILEGE